MHFNTINTGTLDLSEPAIRANKALRGRWSVLSVRWLQSGGGGGAGHAFEEAIRRRVWVDKRSSVQTRLKTRQKRRRSRRSARLKRLVIRLHVCRRGARFLSLPPLRIFIFPGSFPVSLKHSYSLAHLMTHEGFPPTRTVQGLRKIKSRRASGCGAVPKLLRVCTQGRNSGNLGRLQDKISF